MKTEKQQKSAAAPILLRSIVCLLAMVLSIGVMAQTEIVRRPTVKPKPIAKPPVSKQTTRKKPTPQKRHASTRHAEPEEDYSPEPEAPKGPTLLDLAAEKASVEFNFRRAKAQPPTDVLEPLVGSLVPGWSTMDEVRAIMHEHYGKDEDNSISLNGGYSSYLMRVNKSADSIAHKVVVFGFPDEWKAKGLTDDLSFNECLNWLSSHGFTISQNSPTVYAGSLTGYIAADDYKTGLRLVFQFYNNKGLSQLTDHGTLGCIEVSRAYRIHTGSEDYGRYFPFRGISPFQTPISSLSGAQSNGDGSYWEAKDGAYTFKSRLNHDVLAEVEVVGSVMPAQWAGTSSDVADMSYNQWLAYLGRNGFNVDARTVKYGYLTAVNVRLGLRFTVSLKNGFNEAKNDNDPGTVWKYTLSVL